MSDLNQALFWSESDLNTVIRQALSPSAVILCWSGFIKGKLLISRPVQQISHNYYYRYPIIGLDLWPAHWLNPGHSQGSEIRFSEWFDNDLSWQSALFSHTCSILVSSCLSPLSLSRLIEMSQCLMAAFGCWSEKESFQPMLMSILAWDKETCLRVLFFLSSFTFHLLNCCL